MQARTNIHQKNDSYSQRKLALWCAGFILVCKTFAHRIAVEMFKSKAAPRPCVLLTGLSIQTAAGRTKTQTKTQILKASERTRAADIKILYQLASDYDSISPNLAAQLRDIAGRH